MKYLRKHLLTSLLSALLPITVPAADLPTLPASKNISSGTLANGINYYIISNPTYKGMADIALVQKAGSSDEGSDLRGMATVNARGALADLPHFMGRTTPFTYLKGKAVHPSGHGFVRVTPDASVYRFENLVLARQADIVDSTLLMVFDIIGREGGKMGPNYAPENQAVIISGDVNEGEIRGKMDMLSMFVAKRQAVRSSGEYQWKDTEEPVVKVVRSWSRNSISAEYRYPRTPAGDMATVLPLVTSRYAAELEILLKKRLSRALCEAGVPYSSIGYSYQSSADKGGDELFRISIYTSAQHLDKATGILAATLAGIEAHGTSAAEFMDIENELSLVLSDRYGKTVIENSAYVDKCIAAFLHGASLASDQDNLRFFSDRAIDAATSSSLFNNFVSALVDRSRNLALICETEAEGVTAGKVKEAFLTGWPSSPADNGRSFSADTTSLRKPSGKTKIRLVSPEPLYGGEMWTFTNGMKIIYKRVPGSGSFHYSWIVKGGFSNMRGLKIGEGAYLADILRTYRISGMKGEDFMDMVRSNGITMDISNSLSEFSISGSARSGKIQLLMKSLLSIAESRSLDADAYRYFRECTDISGEEGQVVAKLDSLMNKEIIMSEHKRPVRLADDLQSRAQKYFDETFARSNDGALIIVGDIDVNLLRKTMLQYIGSFKTEKAYASRSRSHRGTVASRVTGYAVEESPAVGISLSAPINFTSDNFMAANIAAITMQEAVASAISQRGWTAQVSHEVRMFPDEELTMDIVLSQADLSGLPASMMRTDSADVVLELARKAVQEVGSKGISANGLKVAKSVLNNYFESWMKDPGMMTRMLSLRYSYGKDLVTDYKGRISSVKETSVNPLLSALAGGGIAEYVARKRDMKEFNEVPVREQNTIKVEPLRPVPGSFYYPFDGSIVPADTIDLHTLEIVITPPEPADSVTVCPEEADALEIAMPAQMEEETVQEESQETGENQE